MPQKAQTQLQNTKSPLEANKTREKREHEHHPTIPRHLLGRVLGEEGLS